MRKLIIAFLAIAVSMGFAQKEKKGAKTAGGAEQQISAFLDAGREAALKGDTSWQEQNLVDDYSAITGHGDQLSKSDAIAMRKNGDIKYESIEVQDRKIRVYGNTAVAQARTKLKGTYKGQDISGDYWNTFVLVKQGGGWKQVSMATTPIAGGQK